MDKKTERLEIEIPQQLKQALAVSARGRLLTLNDFLVKVLKDAVKQDPQPALIKLFSDQASEAARKRVALARGQALTDQHLASWERVLKTVIEDINDGRFNRPYQFEFVQHADGVSEACLLVQVGGMLNYMAYTPALRVVYDSLTVKSAQALNKALFTSPMFVKKDLERKINDRRIGHMVALSVARMTYLARLDKAIDRQLQT